MSPKEAYRIASYVAPVLFFIALVALVISLAGCDLANVDDKINEAADTCEAKVDDAIKLCTEIAAGERQAALAECEALLDDKIDEWISTFDEWLDAEVEARMYEMGCVKSPAAPVWDCSALCSP